MTFSTMILNAYAEFFTEFRYAEPQLSLLLSVTMLSVIMLRVWAP